MNKKIDIIEALLDIIILVCAIVLCITNFTAVCVFVVGCFTAAFGISIVSAVIKLFRKQE